MTDNGRTRFARLRSILEVPILNEKFWSKVPTVAADAIMIDLEDSATPENKGLARDKILDALAEPEYFAGRQIIVRVNNLSTPWGREDLAALSGAAAALTHAARSGFGSTMSTLSTPAARKVRHASRWGACRSSSRTISKWPASPPLRARRH